MRVGLDVPTTAARSVKKCDLSAIAEAALAAAASPSMRDNVASSIARKKQCRHVPL